MAVESSNQNEVKIKSPQTKVSSSIAKRNRNPSLRVVGGRIYDPVLGKTCHQCRQKTRDFAAACTNQAKNKPCPIMYCHKCLLNRYGENAEEVAVSGEWTCPRCRGICNCSICMKKRGHQPTGILINTAKKTGFSSVSEMLLKGGGQLNSEIASSDIVTSPKKEGIISPTKRGKDVLDNNDVGLPKEATPNAVEKKQKKIKVKNENDCEKKDEILVRRTSPRKFKKCNEMSNKEAKVNVGVEIEEKDKSEEEEDDDNADGVDLLEQQLDDLQVGIKLPLGTELKSVAGIDVPKEDVGNALQFLEFCTVFGKVLKIKKGQPESVLRDLLHGRTGRRGKFSVTVQFHIHLLSIIKSEQGEECEELSPSPGRNSWFNAFKECLSKSVLEAQRLDHLENTADYETLGASEKLKLLNILCDEILGTEKVRTWMVDQQTELAEKAKETRKNLIASNGEEKKLKMKMKDEIAKAILAGNGGLSISEHEAVVSSIKSETEKAHAKVLESKGLLLNSNETPDAFRIEPIFRGKNGKAYWKLNVTGKSEVLCQNIGEGETLNLEEKWSVLDIEEKEAVEKHMTHMKHISSLREKKVKIRFQKSRPSRGKEPDVGGSAKEN